MTRIGKLTLSCIAIAATFLAIRHGANALHATLPKDMPPNAQFLPSGYDISRNEAEGEWIACRLDPDADADFCRVTDAHGVVIYQGNFLPLSGAQPAPPSDLKVATDKPEGDLWVEGRSADGPVPMIPLVNGQVLAPVVDRFNLATLWTDDPEALRRVQ